MLLQQERELTTHCRRLLPTPGSCSQEAKAAAKKAKVEKAAVRQQAAAAEAKPAGSSKKAKAKQEAEEKRVRCGPEQQLRSRDVYRLLCLCCVSNLCKLCISTHQVPDLLSRQFPAAKALEHRLFGQRPVSNSGLYERAGTGG